MYDYETKSSRNLLIYIDKRNKLQKSLLYLLSLFVRMVKKLKKKIENVAGDRMDGRLYLINKATAKACTLGREWTTALYQ